MHVQATCSTWEATKSNWAAIQDLSAHAKIVRVQSLYYRGLSEPSDVVQHCLTVFRRARVPDLLPYLACQPDEARGVVTIGSQEVHEKGPLAPLSGKRQGRGRGTSNRRLRCNSSAPKSGYSGCSLALTQLCMLCGFAWSMTLVLSPPMKSFALVVCAAREAWFGRKPLNLSAAYLSTIFVPL